MASVMGQLSWPRWFGGNKPTGADQTQMRRYLELAVKCIEKVQSTLPPRQFNLRLCQFLATKLEQTVQQAQECLNPNRPHPPGRINASHERSFQLLFRLAMDVEDFIHKCSCQKQWIRAALMWRNASEHVSMLGYDLDICRVLMRESIWRNESNAAMRTMTELSAGRRREVEGIRLLARLDQNQTLETMEALIKSSNPDPDKRQLATCVLGRLTAAPPTMAASHGSLGPSPPSSWEVDFDSLEPDSGSDHHLARSSAGRVDKIFWHGEQFAEKTFDGSDDPSIANEISILAGLQSHPNVIQLVCHAKDDCGGRYIVMELMDGDLFHLMRRARRWNRSLKAPFIISEAVEIMLQVAQGVDHLHENRIVHRDLKSQNILFKIAKDVNLEGHVYVKVGDFGLSKLKERSSTLNQTMSTGTTRWMAPELLEPDPGAATNQASTSNLKPDFVETLKHPFKCDIYSLGMVFYEILSGKVPFHSTSSHNEVKRMVLNGDRPELPDDCPLRLEDLIDRCWDREPSSRPSVGEICAELRYLRCVLMTGGDVNNCEPINFPHRQQHTMQARASLAAYAPLERAFSSGPGTSSTVDEAFQLRPQYTGACSVHMTAACATCASG